MTPPSPPSGPPPPAGFSEFSTDERRHHLIEWLRSGRKLTTSLAAGALSVSRRTIARDLAHLRDTLLLDISFDPGQETYVLAEEHTALPFLAFPSLVPVLLDGRVEGDGELPSGRVRVRISARAVQSYVARGGRISGGTPNEDGSLDVHFDPQNLDEFISYVLSRGHHAEVLSPDDVRRRVHMEIRRMMALYERPAAPDA
jgi:predicted DNA-binding transcriptional regulator YafY